MKKNKAATAKAPNMRAAVPASQSDPGKHHAQCALLSEVNASALIEMFGRDVFGAVEGQRVYERLQDVTHDDAGTKVSERMLLSQAHSLDVMFANLGRRAASLIGHDRLNAMETYMRLALRAQNQARMTLETLATIKNPPVVFAKQANIANNQQVNNGEAVPVTRAGENQKQQAKLLEAPGAKPEWMDTGTSRAAAPGDPAMAAVEAFDRPTNKRRKGAG